MNKQTLYRIGGVGLGVLVIILLFSYMSLAVFLAVCVGLVGRMALIDFRVTEAPLREQNSRYYTQKVLHYLSVTVAGVAAACTLYNYWGAPERIFKNADHHALAHLGYQFGRTLTLADEQKPRLALWDKKHGQLRVESSPTEKRFTLTGQRFYEPIFLRNDAGYTLSNAPVEETFDSTLTVEFSRGRRLTLSVQHLNAENVSYHYRYAEADSTYAPLKIAFKTIRTGISLRDLISRNPEGMPGFEEVLALLDSTYLLRQSYFIEGNDRQNTSPMRLFPSRLWADSVVALSLDGVPVALDRRFGFDIPVNAGQSFFVGLRTKRTKTYSLQPTGDHTAALYLGFPERKYLRSSEADQETLFLTSSAGRVADNPLMTGLLFDGPEREENFHHLAANLSYRTGRTTEKMHFRVVNEVQERDLSDESAAKIVSAGDTLRLATTGAATNPQHEVYWILSVIDLKATNGLPWWALVGFVFGFTILALVSIFLTPLPRINNSFKVEVAVYVTLLAFMVVRTVILWRAVTFVPLDDIAPIDYETLRGLKKYFWLQTYFTLGFFALIIGSKMWIFRLGRSLPSIPRWQWLNQSWVPYSLFVLYGLVALKGIGSLERLVSVLVPVSVYFLIDFVFQRRAVALKGYATKSAEYRLVRKINGLAALAAFALGDAGFSLVFILFLLVYWYLRILVFPDHRLKSQQPNNALSAKIWPYRSLLIALAITVFIWFSPQFLSLLFRHLLISVQFILGLLVLLVWREKYLSLWVRAVVTVVLIAAMGLAIPFQSKLQEVAETKNRMLYRAEVRFRSADDIIASEKFNLGNDRRLLNAAQNQWFINYFYEKGELSLHHYFKRVPHFQQGSSYLTQISDLVSVRYVIAEHSEWVLIGLILLLGLLTFLSVRNRMPFHAFTKLRAQLLCFLFALAFTIWLTASDRMVFVGQDFPMLSMNSFLTLLVGFGLLSAAVLAGYGGATEPETHATANTFELKGSKRFMSWAVQSVIGIAFWSWVLFSKNVQQFDLNQTVARLEETIDGLNTLFERYQTELAKTSKKSLQPAEAVNGFEAYLQREAKDFFKGKVFERSVYDSFRTRYVQSNSPEQLVHLRKNEEGNYEFAVNNFFYNVNSPDVFQNTWRGHLTSASVYRSLSLNNLNATSRHWGLDTNKVLSEMGQLLGRRQLLNENENLNIRLSFLPAGWAKDSLPVVIVGRTQGEERQTRSSFLIKNGTDLLSATQTRHAIALRPNDVLHLQPLTETGDKSRIVSLKVTQKEEGYLAKNVWLNGRPRHFYPLQERSLWSYFFTNLVKSSYDKKPELWQKNVELTLDPVLSKQIYDRVQLYFGPSSGNEKRGFSLVVLDSEGSIKALSDYKTDPRMHIDPNRMSDYKEQFEDLYMGSATFNERNLLGNRCLLRMPNGPASTFKPILYGAVTSQYDLGWPHLEFGGIGNYPSENAGGKNDRLIRHFGGRKMRLIVNENHLIKHDNIDYISRSTNTYNAMVVYLGSLSPNQLDDAANGLRTGTSSNYLLLGAHPTDPKHNFPLLEYKNRKFRIHQMPAWDQKTSLISTGLSDNFHLPVSQTAEHDAAGIGHRNLASGLEDAFFNASRSSYKLWSFPEASHLFLIDRTVNTQNAVPQLAMGAYPITVTPLKMAEMAANLFSFNPNLRASVLADHAQTTKGSFSVGDTWKGENNLLSFYSHNLFQAMNQAVESGTAKFVSDAKSKGYTYYAKTGTISGNRQGGDSRDKNLMLIISKNPLHQRSLTAEDLRTNPFYVLYFSFYSDATTGDWSKEAKTTVQDLIRYVQHSDGFRQLMKEKK
ncbi:MAG: penicillin-binding transpeptidase domain-containing protein [Spirosomataceae bacterium]